MKANELRIGNLVSAIHPRYHEKEIVVESISGTDSINVDFRSYSLDEIEPIPLTEDWLLKFGFNKDAPYYLKHPLIVGLLANEKDVNYCESEDSEDVLQLSKVELKYVHQLQNLYFALAGKELSIE